MRSTSFRAVKSTFELAPTPSATCSRKRVRPPPDRTSRRTFLKNNMTYYYYTFVFSVRRILAYGIVTRSLDPEGSVSASRSPFRPFSANTEQSGRAMSYRVPNLTVYRFEFRSRFPRPGSKKPDTAATIPTRTSTPVNGSHTAGAPRESSPRAGRRFEMCHCENRCKTRGRVVPVRCLSNENR